MHNRTNKAIPEREIPRINKRNIIIIIYLTGPYIPCDDVKDGIMCKYFNKKLHFIQMYAYYVNLI